jgi:hypothetical protein
MEFYSTIGRMKLYRLLEKWMEVEIIMLSELSGLTKTSIMYLLSYVECREKKGREVKMVTYGCGKGKG